jgi:hypothetical protein
MSKRSTGTPQRPPAGGPAKTRVGSRTLARQARQLQARGERRRPPRAPLLRIPSFDPLSMLRRVPRAAWLCALVAFVNAASWSFVSPPFQVPDEPSHFAYVKQLAETGRFPTTGLEKYSSEEEATLSALHYNNVRLGPANQTISTSAQQRKLEQQLELGNRLPKKGSQSAGVATSEPPLYYALETIPYGLASGGTLLDRLQLMRLFSALWAGLTALFAFLFLREALPSVRWAWTVGAMCVALCPLLGFTSGAVTPDSMLFAVSAALLYCIARAFRRGLTTRSAIATGLVIATGFLTKLNFVGIAPGAYLALGILAVRGVRRSGRDAVRAPAIAAAIGCVPVLLAEFIGKNSSAEVTGGASGTATGSLLDKLDYIWQLYLPRLPGTVNDFPGLSTARQIWFDGYVGRFGWLDTYFPGWVYTVALILAIAIVLLCARSLLAGRAALRARLPELAVYAVMTVGLMGLIGAASYTLFPVQAASFGQARYLLPLLPLFAAVLALAARGAGRRWGPVAGALFVVVFLGHDVFSQLQVIARYYG